MDDFPLYITYTHFGKYMHHYRNISIREIPLMQSTSEKNLQYIFIYLFIFIS